MNQLSLFDFAEETAAEKLVEQTQTHADIVELINRRRRQIVVHSELYYRLNTSLIPDSTYDAWSRELVELQRKQPDIASHCVFTDLFTDDYDGSTGFQLCGTPWGYNKALELLRYAARL